LVALGAGIGVTLAKVGAAVFTGSTALAAEAAHLLADNANDLCPLIAQRRSSRPPDDQRARTGAPVKAASRRAKAGPQSSHGCPACASATP
jgi:Cation efflux family